MNYSKTKPTVSLKRINKITLLTIMLFCINSRSISQNAFVYDNGTNWQSCFYDIIKSSDPSTFKSVSFETKKYAEMWDRDANNNRGAWINPKSWIFRLSYVDGIESEIRIRQLGFKKDDIMNLAKEYGKKMGQLPYCLRKGVKYINILKSDALFGGNNSKHSIEITIGKTSELYNRTGNMEEILFHEATHAALDNLYKENWIPYRDKDSKFISKYAANNPNREDISESFLVYVALNFRSDRVTSEMSKIKQSIPNRLNFFKNKDLNIFPFSKK